MSLRASRRTSIGPLCVSPRGTTNIDRRSLCLSARHDEHRSFPSLSLCASRTSIVPLSLSFAEHAPSTDNEHHSARRRRASRLTRKLHIDGRHCCQRRCIAEARWLGVRRLRLRLDSGSIHRQQCRRMTASASATAGRPSAACTTTTAPASPVIGALIHAGLCTQPTNTLTRTRTRSGSGSLAVVASTVIGYNRLAVELLQVGQPLVHFLHPCALGRVLFFQRISHKHEFLQLGQLVLRARH
jgi:hypothetical protein